LELGDTAASVLISIPTFIEGISKQLAPMFVLFAFNGLLSQLVSLGEWKSQALTADRSLNESFVRVDAKLPSEHRTRFGAERKLTNLGVNRCLAAQSAFHRDSPVRQEWNRNQNATEGGEVIEKRSRIRLCLRSR
jgi:hypothetical protein